MSLNAQKLFYLCYKAVRIAGKTAIEEQRGQAMGIRAERKEKTRRTIIQSALKLSRAQGFACLSLREVTREAGIAPTSFYRHFKDMDQLGLVLVEEIAGILRHLIRNARNRVRIRGSAVRASLEVFLEYLEQNEEHFRLLIGERFSHLRDYQREIKKELERFICELAEDLQKECEANERPMIDTRLAAEMMIEVAFNAGVNSLQLPSAQRQEILEQLVTKTQIILLGAEANVQGWYPGRGAAIPPFEEDHIYQEPCHDAGPIPTTSNNN